MKTNKVEKFNLPAGRQEEELITDKLKAEIALVFEREIQPQVELDGGQIDFVEIDKQGVVKVVLSGACEGCGLAGMTLQLGVFNTLQNHFGEVITGVVAV